jgi:hypothetical protein
MARYTVTLELNPRWVKLARSPLYFLFPAGAGVSTVFAPLFLYWSGQGRFFPGLEWLIVPSCFVVIYCVQLFFMAFGNAAVTSLRREPAEGENSPIARRPTAT